ncbi:hypothetical protein RHGRI_038496 [Rhododendron griersonianum]|uniref:Uncharacterized protein n=1 Tax=Rhododendron griersonianum TaxID=479676 RepID=A0AAV6HM31_9ERIC|nr:hypothetical protein RHGRI_038496 [Rhododendron griersonianum]
MIIQSHGLLAITSIIRIGSMNVVARMPEQVIDHSIMKTKTTTFFLVLFVTLLLALGPLQADAEKANYRRLLSDGWNYDAGASSGDSSHHHTTGTEPTDTRVHATKRAANGRPWVSATKRIANGRPWVSAEKGIAKGHPFP